MSNVSPPLVGAVVAGMMMTVRVLVLGTGQSGILASRIAFIVASAAAGAVAGVVYERTARWRVTGGISRVLSYWATGTCFMLVIFAVVFSDMTASGWATVGLRDLALAFAVLLGTGAAAGVSVFVIVRTLQDD